MGRRASEALELVGEPIAEFGPAWSEALSDFRSGILGAVLPSVVIGLIAFSQPISAGGQIAIGVLSVFALGGALFLISAIRISRRRVAVYGDGLIDGRTVLRWEDIDEMCYGTTFPDCAIRSKSGRKFNFASGTIDRPIELCEWIVQLAEPVLARQWMNSIRAGETVNFGRVEADRKGILCHEGPFRSPKARSFYKGPWPRQHRGSKKAKEATKEFAWGSLADVNEQKDQRVWLQTTDDSWPLACTAKDAPNIHFLPYLSSLMTSAKAAPAATLDRSASGPAIPRQRFRTPFGVFVTTLGGGSILAMLGFAVWSGINGIEARRANKNAARPALAAVQPAQNPANIPPPGDPPIVPKKAPPKKATLEPPIPYPPNAPRPEVGSPVFDLGRTFDNEPPPRPPGWFKRWEPKLPFDLQRQLDPKATTGLAAEAPLWNRLKAAVADRQFRKWNLVGKDRGTIEFEDIPAEGGLLVGFFVSNQRHLPYAQSIYLTAKGEVAGRALGTPDPKSICLKAKPGYAVGGIYAHAGDLTNALALTFMKIGDNGLDPDDRYQSAWVGTDGGSPGFTKHDGSYIVGIHGKANDAYAVGTKGSLASMSVVTVP